MDEDAREVELSTITFIYPEIQIDDKDPYAATLEIPVNLDKPVTVLFPAIALATPLANAPPTPTHPEDHQPESDSHQLSHLPSLRVKISLPDNYPEDKPPNFSISTDPPWLPQSTLEDLEGSAERLWEERGRDQVVFTIIDDIQRSAEDVFGLVAANGALQVGPEHKIAILDHDIKAKKEAFEKGTFDCGICLDPKKGTACHKMLDCGHVFCVQCLQDFYNNAIKEGNVAAVQCLEPSCAKEREAELTRETSNKKKRRKPFISPSELLQIPLEQDVVKRYVDMKYKTELESDKDTVYCPRSWCQGAARSKKHKKPQGLELSQQSDEEDLDASHGKNKAGLNGKKKKASTQDHLRVCEDCGFAFCARCRQSWHGEYVICVPQERKDAMTEEEQASHEFLSLYTTPCPTCSAPCQKSGGCNHMACFRCQTHFCYLCSSWLDPTNPYKHFNTPYGDWGSGCYMRLWELEEGDNGPGRNEPVGGRGGRNDPVQGPPGNQPNQADLPNDNDGSDDDDDDDDDDNEAGGAAGHQPRQPGAAVAREGPLVLRIEGDAARAPPQRAPSPPAQQNQNPPAAGRNRGFGRRQRGGGRGDGRNNNNNNNNNHRNRNQHQRPQQQQGRVAPRHQQQQQQGDMAIGDLLRQEGELNARQQEWIRNFVELALQDQEDQLEWDSDEDW